MFYIYIYKEYKFQTIYMHNTSIYQCWPIFIFFIIIM
jgi:hypothetical protein